MTLARTSRSDHSPSPVGPLPRNLVTSMAYQHTRMKNKTNKFLCCFFLLLFLFAEEKAKVKLQRIEPGTKWRQAKIEVVDTLSAFYVENLDPKIHEKFEQMFTDLQ